MLREELGQQSKKGILEENEVESALAESGLFPLLRRNRPFTMREWSKVSKIISDKLPAFSQLILSKKDVLDAEESKLCILFRLHCTQKEICALTGMSQSNVSKHASQILMKLTNKRGGSRMLVHYLEEYC